MKESPGRIEFLTLVVAGGPGGSSASVPVPREVSAALGNLGRVELRGTLNGKPLRAPAMPDGKGGHTLQISREQLNMVGAAAGQRVKIVLERIEQEAPVEPPPDLAKALSKNIQARAGWEKFPSASRRAWVEYVSSKKPEERTRRIQEAIGRIALGKTP